jgi:hypothetical protein
MASSATAIRSPRAAGAVADSSLELSVFTLAYAHCLALQVAKDLKSYGLAPRAPLAWTAALALAIACAHARPSSSRALMGLAATGLVLLCVHGSQSNHVIVEIALTVAVLVTAPSRGASGREARTAWTARLTLCIRLMLAVLYGSTALAKLNNAWFDPSSSCCVQMATAMLRPLAPTWRPLLLALPVSAIAFEIGFPLLLIAALGCGRSTQAAAASPRAVAARRAILRSLMVAGSAFHAAIALPPPPLSVYPFSMAMAPFYILGLLPDEVGATARRVAAAPARVHAALAAAAAAATAAAVHRSFSVADRFEYPPYFAWELGVLWSLAAFGALAAVGLFAPAYSLPANAPVAPPAGDDPAPGLPKPTALPSPLVASSHPALAKPAAQDTGPASPAISSCRLLALLIPPLFLALLAATPYVGMRDHPSLAMFSNLEIGGGASNHWLFPPVHSPPHDLPRRGTAPPASPRSSWPLIQRLADWLAPPEFSSSKAILITATDHPGLRSLQVNLAPLLPADTRAAIASAGACASFYISPPAWDAPPTEAFIPVAVPVVEVRRRIATAGPDAAVNGASRGTARPAPAAAPADFYFRYRAMERGTPMGTERTYRRVRGLRTGGSDPALDEPIPPLRAALHRFRAFDHQRPVCRH